MKSICLVVLLLWCSVSFSQNTFLESFYTAGVAQNMFGKKTSDSGYLLYGFNGFTGNNLFTITDSNGIIKFSKYYNLPIDYRVYDAFESQNGYTLLSTGINNSVCFIKTDQNGMFISGKSYYSPLNNIGLNWLGQIGTDIYLYGAIGNSSSIVKMDSSGTILWVKLYAAQFFNKGVISKNNELYLNGQSSIIKLDSAGNSIWNVQFQHPGGSQFDLTEESGVIVSTSNFVMKVDSLGAVEWKKFYIVDTAHYLDSWGIKSTKDDGYIMAGNYKPTNSSLPQSAFLLHIDQQGTPDWIKKYGIINNHVVTSCEVASDSGYVVFGTSSGFASTSSSHYGFILKTDKTGNLGCFDNSISVTDSSITNSSTTLPVTYSTISLPDSLFIPVPFVTDEPSAFICSSTTNIKENKNPRSELYPNPINNKALLKASVLNQYLFIAYDIFGEIIFSMNINSLETELDFSNLQNGIYFYQLNNSESNFTGKFIVAH